MSSIPSDVATRLQNTADAALRPVAPTQDIADRLSGLSAGDRILAQIQALLPNGTYRALINQRSITLALPFSAKAGDSLELLVTESDGKLALAVIGRPDGAPSKAGGESVSATLSRAGQLISALSSNGRQGTAQGEALPLNNNQPLASAPPAKGLDLLPQLKQALTQSGMFYEAHQAEWVEGRLTQRALLQEPQGRLSSPAAFTADAEPNAVSNAVASERATPIQSEMGEKQPPVARPPEQNAPSPRAPESALPLDPAGKPAISPGSQQPSAQLVALQLQPIVQQQLEALATQNFAWQGQVWPGQEMRWEIEEDGQKANDDLASASAWTTRLRLELPHLGEVEAQIRLHENQLLIAIRAADDTGETLLRQSGEALRQQLQAVGLTLGGYAVSGTATAPASENNG